MLSPHTGVSLHENLVPYPGGGTAASRTNASTALRIFFFLKKKRSPALSPYISPKGRDIRTELNTGTRPPFPEGKPLPSLGEATTTYRYIYMCVEDTQMLCPRVFDAGEYSRVLSKSPCAAHLAGEPAGSYSPPPYGGGGRGGGLPLRGKGPAVAPQEPTPPLRGMLC